MNCERFQVDFDDYLHGVLPPVRAAEIQEHLRTCLECRGWIGELQTVNRRLSSWRPLESRPDSVEYLLDSLRGGNRKKPRPRWPAAAAALLLISTAGVVLLHPPDDGPDPVPPPQLLSTSDTPGEFTLTDGTTVRCSRNSSAEFHPESSLLEIRSGFVDLSRPVSSKPLIVTQGPTRLLFLHGRIRCETFDISSRVRDPGAGWSRRLRTIQGIKVYSGSTGPSSSLQAGQQLLYDRHTGRTQTRSLDLTPGKSELRRAVDRILQSIEWDDLEEAEFEEARLASMTREQPLTLLRLAIDGPGGNRDFPSLQRWAETVGRALVHCGDPSLLDPLEGLLKRMTPKENPEGKVLISPLAIERAVAIARLMGPRKGSRKLLDIAAGNENPHVQYSALYAMNALIREGFLSPEDPLVQEEYWPVLYYTIGSNRLSGVEAAFHDVGTLPELRRLNTARTQLLGMMRDDPHASCRAVAARFLIPFERDAVLPEFRVLFEAKDTSDFVRESILAQTGSLGTAEAARFLLSLLRDPKHAAMHTFAYTELILLDVQEDAALDVLFDAFRESRDKDIAGIALQALARQFRLQEESAFRRLILSRFRDPSLRRKAVDLTLYGLSISDWPLAKCSSLALLAELAELSDLPALEKIASKELHPAVRTSFETAVVSIRSRSK